LNFDLNGSKTPRKRIILVKNHIQFINNFFIEKKIYFCYKIQGKPKMVGKIKSQILAPGSQHTASSKEEKQ